MLIINPLQPSYVFRRSSVKWLGDVGMIYFATPLLCRVLIILVCAHVVITCCAGLSLDYFEEIRKLVSCRWTRFHSSTCLPFLLSCPSWRMTPILPDFQTVALVRQAGLHGHHRWHERVAVPQGLICDSKRTLLNTNIKNKNETCWYMLIFVWKLRGLFQTYDIYM